MTLQASLKAGEPCRLHRAHLMDREGKSVEVTARAIVVGRFAFQVSDALHTITDAEHRMRKLCYFQGSSDKERHRPCSLRRGGY